MASKQSFKPIITLYVLSPVICELLLGSTPLSRIHLLLIESLLYGSGAILIREIVVRTGKSWGSVILLGVAFGVVEECLLLQSAFNPNFLNLDMTFGRKWGVNWPWAQYIIGYHALWSITIPIVIVGLLFPLRKDERWLSNFGVVAWSIVYVFAGVMHYVIFKNMLGFVAPIGHSIVATIVALLFVVVALTIPRRVVVQMHSSLSAWTVFIASTLFGLLWLLMLGLVFTKGSGIPSWAVQISGGILIGVTLAIVLNKKVQAWKDLHRFGAIVGCLISSMLF